MKTGAVILFFLISPFAWAEEICAGRFSELAKTERLATLKLLFSADQRITMVNGTKGSYVIIDSLDDALNISFFTSGIFDLYPVRKDGPLQFCDDGEKLRMVGLGRREVLTIKEGQFHLGGESAKKTFSHGEMPEPLKKMHRMDERGIASKP